jgi:hypothetical protein
MHNFCCGKNIAQKSWASFVIFQQLPKENNHPRGEKSPNLVTLAVDNLPLSSSEFSVSH